MPRNRSIFRRKIFLCASVFLLALATVLVWQWPRVDALAGTVSARIGQPHTVQERIDEYGEPVQKRLRPLFEKNGVAYPPTRITLIGLKEEKRLELWASNADGPMRWIKTYPIKAASGGPGPKLREGDRQVPEGIYAIESLNPNSRYHLSLRINYPNSFDRAQAKKEGRSHLGGDIMIHGKAVSIGCLAMGDPAAEEIFLLGALTGVENIQVLLCPVDLRHRDFPPPATAPAWTTEVYHALKTALQNYPASPTRW